MVTSGGEDAELGKRSNALRNKTERTTISQKKSKTTEAVANRGVGADAPIELQYPRI